MPTNFYDLNDRVLKVTITWTDPANDLDLYVCQGTALDDPQCLLGLVGSSTRSGTTSESVFVRDPTPGHYRLIAAAAGGATAYTGNVSFTGPASPASMSVRSKSNGFAWDARPVADDSNFGEPSIDLDHATVNGSHTVATARSFSANTTSCSRRR